MKNLLFQKLYISLLWCLMTIMLTHKTNAQTSLPTRDQQFVPGSVFYQQIRDLPPDEREERIKKEFLEGNFPNWMRVLERIDIDIIDNNQQIIRAHLFAMPDYLMIGSDDDFVRLPVRPTTAREIADSLGFFLPTAKLVDDIYRSAAIKLSPVPMTENRESIETFLEHHHIIERQRGNRKGLIAGIKKDIISTARLYNAKDSNRVAIYGWHRLDGTPIQPIFVGHSDSYVDYSHGLRLIHAYIVVNGKKMHFLDIMNDTELKGLLCHEEDCRYYYQ